MAFFCLPSIYPLQGWNEVILLVNSKSSKFYCLLILWIMILLTCPIHWCHSSKSCCLEVIWLVNSKLKGVNFKRNFEYDSLKDFWISSIESYHCQGKYSGVIDSVSCFWSISKVRISWEPSCRCDEEVAKCSIKRGVFGGTMLIESWYNSHCLVSLSTFFPIYMWNSHCPRNVLNENFLSETNSMENKLCFNRSTYNTSQSMLLWYVPSMKHLIIISPSL